jgi:2-phospho-L-lactate/phosphoenolpyruvate guanylyltransferase
MRAVLLPVKDLRNAKQRLAQVLTSTERTALAQAMLTDTVRALRGVTRADKIFVVTNYAPAIELAQQNSWQVLREDQQISESVSVDTASTECQRLGITALLRLPLDVPLVQSPDIDELLDAAPAAPSLVIVPSRDSAGTNAILRTPPTLFPSHFGSGSFAKHLAEAARTGANIVRRRNIRLEMDVDDEADLRALLERDLSGTHTGQWLIESGVAAKFSNQQDAKARVAAKI